jgi:AcrR family transcriptional regulator
MRSPPVQKRSIETVQRILCASANLLREHQFSDVSTTMIASAAFVSPGTVYKYFADKESIYLRAYETTASRCANEIRRALISRIDSPMETSLPQLVELMLSLHEENRTILIDLVEQAPNVINSVRSLAVDNLVKETSHIYLQSQNKKLDEMALRTCIYFLIRNVIVESIRRYILEKRTDIERSVFVDETAKIAYLYFRCHE